MTELDALAPTLAEMRADAGGLRGAAALEPDGDAADALCACASRIDHWRARMRRLAVTLDEIVADAAEEAKIAEEQARWRAMRARADVLPFRTRCPGPPPFDPRPAA